MINSEVPGEEEDTAKLFVAFRAFCSPPLGLSRLCWRRTLPDLQAVGKVEVLPQRTDHAERFEAQEAFFRTVVPVFVMPLSIRDRSLQRHVTYLAAVQGLGFFLPALLGWPLGRFASLS